MPRYTNEQNESAKQRGFNNMWHLEGLTRFVDKTKTAYIRWENRNGSYDDLQTILPEVVDHRAVLLALIASLTLADHMGDAMSAAYDALEKIGLRSISLAESETELAKCLHDLQVTTLYGTELWSEFD